MERNYISSALLHPFLILILLFCNQGTIFSQGKEAISKKDLQEYMNFIASDATEGRLTGTSGYKKAADYTVDIFKKAGLQPAWTNVKGEKTYLQPVPFIRYTYDNSTFITIKKNSNNKTFAPSASNFVIINPGNRNKNAPVASPVFIGYGIHEPENGWDDYAGVDVKEKWVILLQGIPPVDENPEFPDGLRKQYTDITIRDSLIYKALNEHQIAGVIALPGKYVSENWEYQAPRKCHFYYMPYADPDVNLKATPERVLPNILISPNLAEILLDKQSYNPITNKGNYQSYVLSNTEISIAIDCHKDTINCYNVVAVLPGSDSSLRNEYLTVGAHLDHLGKMGDHVYNGANDDASGCVIILGAAKALAINPLKRSVLFTLYTSEEQNLDGSEHFLKYPPIPIEQISLNINIEQIGSKNRDYNGIWGIGLPQFNDAFNDVSISYPKTNSKYDSDESFINMLEGQVDSWNYIKKEIPIVMLSSGGFPEHHNYKDKIDLIDFDHLFVASNFLYSFIVKLGNE